MEVTSNPISAVAALTCTAGDGAAEGPSLPDKPGLLRFPQGERRFLLGRAGDEVTVADHVLLSPGLNEKLRGNMGGYYMVLSPGLNDKLRGNMGGFYMVHMYQVRRKLESIPAACSQFYMWLFGG